MAQKAPKGKLKKPTRKDDSENRGPFIPDPEDSGPSILDPAFDSGGPLPWLEERSLPIDFENLRAEFLDRLQAFSVPKFPTENWRTRFIIDQARGHSGRDKFLFWAHHTFPGDASYTDAVRRFQSDLVKSGFLDVVEGTTPHPNSLAARALTALARNEMSGSLFDAWFMLGHLLGRQLELENRERGNATAFFAGIKSAAFSANEAQKIWFARWLLTNCKDLSRDRGEQEGIIQDLCWAVTRGKIASPNTELWPPEWFSRLLQGRALADRISRLREKELRALANNKLVPSGLLPPLRLDAFPMTGVKPPPGGG